eukprot:5687944-Alexandrium_andersonii.AAC.1
MALRADRAAPRASWWPQFLHSSPECWGRCCSLQDVLSHAPPWCTRTPWLICGSEDILAFAYLRVRLRRCGCMPARAHTDACVMGGTGRAMAGA